MSIADDICEIAMNSPIADYEWEDRGRAPPGYTQGMAVAFATVVRKWLIGDPGAQQMAQANTHEADTDALSWYAGVFEDRGMDNSEDGLDTLRHLFVLLIGLGMRESSGQHCEGRDMSADNVTADTCEAGLFQTSWNIADCSDQIPPLLDEYCDEPPTCALPIFAEGVACSASDWQSYGSGDGRAYQDLAKACPQFAVEVTAIGLRYRRSHWGPINRYEVEVLAAADDMFQQVQDLVAGEIPGPQARVKLRILKTGRVLVRVNGMEL